MDSSAVPATWPAAIACYDQAQAAAGLSPETIATRRRELRTLADRYPKAGPWDLTGEQLAAWLADRAPATAYGYRSAAACFYAWALAAGLVVRDPLANVATVPEPGPRPRPVRDADYAAALALAPSAAVRLMVRLAGELGLRRGEVARVRVDDLHEADDGWWLTVHGKGRKLRDVPCPDELAAAIVAAAGDGPGWAFPGPHGHLAPDTVGAYVGRVLPRGYSAHKLRHRFATRAYDLEHDVLAVQELLGHARPSTTRRYVQTAAGSMRRTVEALERAR